MVKGMRRANFPDRMNEKIPMMRGCITEARIMGVLPRGEGRFAVPELYRNHGIGSARFCK